MAAVDLAHQVLARDRHVLGIAGAEKVMALVGAGAAVDAAVEVDAQRAVVLDEIAESRDRLVMPVLDQLARKAERRLDCGVAPDRASFRHGAEGERRDFQRIRVQRAFVCFLRFGVGPLRPPCLADGGASRRMAALARVVGLIA